MMAIVAHLECTEPMLEDWLDIYGYDINPVCSSTQDLSSIREAMAEKMQPMQVFAEKLYARWLQWLEKDEWCVAEVAL